MMRVVKAVHGVRAAEPDPEHEVGLAAALRREHDAAGLRALYERFAAGDGHFDGMMRRVLIRAAAKRCGDGLRVAPNAGFLHVETFEIGRGVFIGSQAYVQGRFDGRCVIGDRVWIGPQAYLDARDLEIGDDVGWGPGAKVLGSAHTGVPADVPIIATDLEIKPVRVEAEVDVGVNVVILPGVTIGKGAIVGAGAVVTEDVAPFAVVAGVPARFLRWREGCAPQGGSAR